MRDWRAVGCIVVAALTVAQCNFPQLDGLVADRCVYSVGVTVHVSGTPVIGGDGRPMEVAEGWGGTATAVSSDGDLLTARHVVDLGYGSPELCIGSFYSGSWGVLLKDARLIGVDIVVRDSLGASVWRGRAIPAPGMFICDTGNRLRLIWDPFQQASVVAVDGTADLALLHIAVAKIPYLEMQRTAVAAGTPVIALGIINGFMVEADGTVAKPCVVHPASHPYHAAHPRMAMSLYLRHGMSGGPAIVDGRLVGINIQMGAHAVPTTYAAPWYDYATGRRPDAPSATCS